MSELLNVPPGYDVPALAASLDWVAVMTYDYHGQWDKKTGHVAPMYVHPTDSDATFNTVSNAGALPWGTGPGPGSIHHPPSTGGIFPCL